MDKFDLTHYSFKQLMELDGCTRCGECVQWCPTYAEDGQEPLQPAEKIRRMRSFIRAQYGLRARLFGPKFPPDGALEDYSRGVYGCTLCGRCNVVCPVKIETRPLWIAMREHLVQLGRYPEVFDTLRDTVTTKYNISGDDNEDRLIWSDNLERVPEGVKGREKAEVVFFVGCVPSFYPQVYRVPQSMAQIMEVAGVEFATLGGEEWCCGFPLIISGMGKSAEELVSHNVEAVRKMGAKRLVTACPSCFHTWKADYPQIMGEPLGFEVQHSTELLADLISQGKVRLGQFPHLVTYHDPCDLGRSSGVYDPPRQVIEAIPGVTLVEMAQNREHALCCGGGGDVEMAERDLVSAIAARKVEMALNTGAEIIVSACPQCERTMSAEVRAQKKRVRVLDVTEMVWRVMEKDE